MLLGGSIVHMCSNARLRLLHLFSELLQIAILTRNRRWVEAIPVRTFALDIPNDENK